MKRWTKCWEKSHYQQSSFSWWEFSSPDICSKFNPAERKGSRRFLECGKEAFLTHLVSAPAREGTSLELFFVNRGGLVGDALVGGCLGHSGHNMMSFLVSEKERESAE